MKKKSFALALAGVMAMSILPAFAADNSTTVGYVAGGTASTDGRVMVTVPKDVTFTNTSKEASGFDVKALVWDSAASKWTTPSAALPLGKIINVKVASANGYKLESVEATGAVGLYEYVVNDPTGGNATQTLDSKIAENTETAIGTLQDETTTDAGDQLYTIGGAVKMTQAPNVGQNEKGVYFSDTLTYTFDGLNN